MRLVKMVLIQVIAALLLFPPCLFAQNAGNRGQDPAVSAPADKPAEPATGKEGAKACMFCVDYGKLVVKDVAHVFTSPARWDKFDWLTILAGTAVVAGTVITLDKTVRDAMQRNQTKTMNDITDQLSKLSDVSFGVLGGFYVVGAVTGNAKAMAVAQDGFATSLIASGIITPVLKKSIGRSRPSDDLGTHFFSPFGSYDGFPSNHATQAFAVATVVSSHYDDFWVQTLSYGAATLVGMARIYSDSHYLSDVVAGALIGTFTARAVVGFNAKERGKWAITPLMGPNAQGVSLAYRF